MLKCHWTSVCHVTADLFFFVSVVNNLGACCSPPPSSAGATEMLPGIRVDSLATTELPSTFGGNEENFQKRSRNNGGDENTNSKQGNIYIYI